jgi:chromosome segregation ATPase
MASRASDDERARANATLEEERARVAELREKLRGAVKKGKTIEKEREALAKLLEDARRASGANAREDAEATGGNEKALETKVAVLRAELESFKAENEALREKLDAAEASSDERTAVGPSGARGSRERRRRRLGCGCASPRRWRRMKN